MNIKNMISHMAKPTLTNKQQLFLQQFHTSRTQKFYQRNKTNAMFWTWRIIENLYYA